jgi:hypothetical protein
MGSDVMSVYIEKFNIQNQRQSSKNKMLKKKFAFSVHFTVSVNCVFVGSVCIHAVISLVPHALNMLISVCCYAPDAQHVFSHIFTSLNLKRILISSK